MKTGTGGLGEYVPNAIPTSDVAKLTNQLSSIHVDTAVGPAQNPNELKTQAAFNYQYNEIGQLTADNTQQISNVVWNVYGKMLSLTDSGNTITFTYDAAGNRISKTAHGITTWYVRDTHGNVMSVYTAGNAAVHHDSLSQTEVDVYGSSRLGILNLSLNCGSLLAPDSGSLVRGSKLFELTNHLGNVLETVSDKKIQHTSNSSVVDYYLADVINANDNYSFGMQMPGRAYTASSGYRYGFNGKEEDPEVKGTGNEYDYGMRGYDPRVGRFLTVDPFSQKYPHYTPYMYSGNKPIQFVDLDGLEETLPWYLRQNKFGDKPVLTLGLRNLPTADRWEYGNYAWYTDQSIVTFAHNAAVAGWNGIASTWNDALDGRSGSDMVQETIQNISETKPSDFKNVQTWENITGALLTAYAIKRLGGGYGAVSEVAESTLARNRTAFAKAFYERAGYSPLRSLQHIRGIDLSKPVTEVIYKKGTQLEQWSYEDDKGNPQLGNYFTLPGADPTKLGISLENRVKVTVTLKEDTKFLKSTVADIPDWRPGESGTFHGGETQLFQTGVKYSVNKIDK